MDAKQAPTESWIEAIRHRYPTERFVDLALTRKLKRRGLPYSIPSVALVAERLDAFIARRLDTSFVVSDVKPLTGGSSKAQFSFRLNWEDKHRGACEESLVLRLQPGESIVETHRQREFEVMREMTGRVAVPRVRWVDPEGDEFGEPALISVFCQGVTRPPRDGQITGPHQNFGPQYRNWLAPQFMRDLALISSFDWRKAQLPSLDKPAEGTTEAVVLGINWQERVWAEDSVEECPLISVAARWLRANAPPVDHVSVVHGDYRGGNFLFRPEDGEITAQLDWELVHLGDRHEDLAHTLNPVFMEKDERGRLLVSGLCTREEFLEGYERQSGLPVDLKRLAYYDIFCNWRSSIMCLGTATRCALARKTHQDILLGWISTLAPIVMRNLHDALSKYA
jgi:aminoglycoside phosphotransferase (APT) family kinase protein